MVGATQNGLIVAGGQRVECRPQPRGVEMGLHSNIKADRAVIANGAFIHLIFLSIEEVKDNFECDTNTAAWKFSTGAEGGYSEIEGTNTC
jgi:hypothetical protein